MIKRIFSLAEAKGLGLSEGFVDKAIDTESKKIVSYMEGSTFDELAIKYLSLGLTEYIIGVNEVDGESASIVDARGTSLSAVFVAMGLGDKYEEEYGDYADLLYRMRNEPNSLTVTRVSFEKLTSTEIKASIASVSRGTAAHDEI